MTKAENGYSRRRLLALAAAAPFTRAALGAKRIPIGLELYSVYKQMEEDLFGTVRAVARMGYEHVEFIPSHFTWTLDYAKQVRKVMDDAGVRCLSTRNWPRSFAPENLPHAIELNKALGSKVAVLTLTEKVAGLDGWKKVAQSLNEAAERLAPAGIRVGYHNHEEEFRPVEGRRPIDVLTSETRRDVSVELDIGSCVCAGADPAKWISQNPGRSVTLHLRDWSPDAAKGFRVLLGEGIASWSKIFKAAESAGGVEFYLIEQEGSAYPPMETAERCLAAFRKLHA